MGAVTVDAVTGKHAGALATLRNGTYTRVSYLAANKCISETACEILCMHFEINCLCFTL